MATDFGFDPTEKKANYYFISYNTEDRDRVAAICRCLYRNGLDMWYDGGLKHDDLWDPIISRKINNCKEYIIFLTRGIVEKAAKKLEELELEEALKQIWIKIEYEKAERFGKRKLIVYLDEIDDRDVPPEISTWWNNFSGTTQRQGIDARRIDSAKEIADMILWELEREKKTNPPQRKPTQSEALPPASTATAGSLLKRAFLFLEDGEWAKADEYAERVLDTDPENGEAYLVKAMAELKAETRSKLSGAAGFAENRNVKKALRFGSDALKRELNGYLEAARAYKVFEAETKQAVVTAMRKALEERRKHADKQRKAEPKQGVRAVEPAEPGQPQTVFFGHYPQTKTGEVKPIEWLVLKREGTRALLISKYALNCQPYHTTKTGVTWETCSLRQWLNRAFVTMAFDAAEQKRIQTTTVTADKNPKFNTSPGNDTTDKVFLLSVTEAKKYFSSDKARKCAPTDYAKSRGAVTTDSRFAGESAACWWWLRSPGNDPCKAARVDNGGSVYGGFFVNFIVEVRPAMWVDLEP